MNDKNKKKSHKISEQSVTRDHCLLLLRKFECRSCYVDLTDMPARKQTKQKKAEELAIDSRSARITRRRATISTSVVDQQTIPESAAKSITQRRTSTIGQSKSVERKSRPVKSKTGNYFIPFYTKYACNIRETNGPYEIEMKVRCKLLCGIVVNW